MNPNSKLSKYGFDMNLTQRINVPVKDKDSSIHGKRIEQKTMPFILRTMTTAQRDTLKPLIGQMIFNTDTGQINIWDEQWMALEVTTTSTSSSSSSSSSSTSITTP